MDQVSPAVQETCAVETSGWNNSRSQTPVSPEASISTTSLQSTSLLDQAEDSPIEIGDTFSSVITAATVTLLDGEPEDTPDTNESDDVHQEDGLPTIQEDSCDSGSDTEHKNKKIKIEDDLSDCIGCVEQVIPINTPGKQQSTVSVALEGDDLWQQFYHAGTEMIITKTGRRMFPGIVASVCGLDPECKYNISLEINLADDHRYKFVNTKWAVVGKAEAHDEDMLIYNHPDSPATGKHWMNNKISFKKIKLSNNRNNKKGQVVALNSMHKYLPRVVVSRFTSKKKSVVVHTHDLEECTFVAVTAYQNDRVTQLKIDYNPFAKAFRESPAEPEMYGVGYTWPPLSPLLSPYGPAYSNDCNGTQLLSPASLQPSPLPQFSAAFANWESPPYSPNYRQQSSNPVFQQHMVGSGICQQQQKPSPLPRFNTVFNNWPEIPQTNSASSYLSLPHHPQRSAFAVPRIEQSTLQTTNNLHNQ